MTRPIRMHVDVLLAPGELAVYRRALHVKTILGSCVAVCLWDPLGRIAGLNHYLLPHPVGQHPPDPRFGSISCRRLIEEMQAAGAAPAKLWAAVIGGGAPVGVDDQWSVGSANVQIALAVLREFGIRVQRQETGGRTGRKLLFDTGTGKLLVHTLGSQLLGRVGGAP
jgi:chemotaxis protein CheD